MGDFLEIIFDNAETIGSQFRSDRGGERFGDKDCRLAPFNFGGWDNAVRLVDKGVEILRRGLAFWILSRKGRVALATILPRRERHIRASITCSGMIRRSPATPRAPNAT